MTNKKKLFIIPVILLVAICLFSGLYTVKENQYAVVRQLGAIQRFEDTPGLKFKIPFIQSVQKITKATIFYDIPESDVITKDKKSMIVDSFVLWKVKDPSALIRTLNAVQGRAEEYYF